MTTFYEIIEGKTYKQLSAGEKEAIQDRQTELVTLFQDAECEETRSELFAELHDSFQGLIKGMSYRQSEKSFSVEQEDFEGLMYEELWKTILSFDRTLGKPFTPVFILNIRNAVKMMYRQKSYDIHETTHDVNSRLDSPAPEGDGVTMIDALELSTGENEMDKSLDVMEIKEVLESTFGTDERKKTIVHMFLDGFKRNEIVSAVRDGKSKDSTARLVNRTVQSFQEAYKLQS